jgi:hypothetical protein
VALGLGLAGVGLCLWWGHHGSTPAPAHGSAALTMAQTESVLPGPDAVPAGWTVSEPASVKPVDQAACTENGAKADEVTVCRQTIATGAESFAAGHGTLTFSVMAGPTREWASSAYQYLAPYDGVDVQPMPALGDASRGVTSATSTIATVRVGTTMVEVYFVSDDSGGTWDIGKLVPYARMLTTRSQQAQSGRTPTATARQAG